MKKFELKNYQKKAKEDLLYRAETLSAMGGKMLLKSTTGSGKTLIATNFIEEYINTNINTVFIWLTFGDGGLQIQSADKLRSNLPDNFNIIEAEGGLSKKYLEPFDIMVLSWDKLNRIQIDEDGEVYNNVLMNAGDKRNLRDVWDNTRNNGYNIVLLIDESHKNTDTKKSQHIIELISPSFIFELTATPKSDNYDYIIEVDPKDIIREGAIKKIVKTNEGMTNVEGLSEIDKIIDTAIKKREELKQAYLDIGIDYINPLCLIQIPVAKLGDEVMGIVESKLDEKGISYNNKNLAKWLSDTKAEEIEIENNNKRNLKGIIDNDSPIEYLIFKNAVGTGWDCPRASILIKLREAGGESFDIQTLGRILRMPEFKHYDNPILNYGYIYSNADRIVTNFQQGDYPNFTIQQELKEEYEESLNIKLEMEKVNRIEFIKNDTELEKAFREEMDKQNLNLNIENASKNVIQEEIDFIEEKQTIIKQEKHIYTETEVERMVKLLFYDMQSYSYDNEKLSRLVYKYLTERFPLMKWLELTKIILLNRILIEQIFDKIKKEDKQKSEFFIIKKEFNFDIERDINKSKDSEEINYRKNAYFPHFKPNEKPENIFELFMEGNENIKYWIKNGDSGADNFSIAYKEENILREFYPDYFIVFKDNTLGIFEVKSMPDLKPLETEAKIEALGNYLEGKEIIGGLVQVYKTEVYLPSLHNKLKAY